MNLRRFILVTHRWLGLGTSAVLVIAGGTGAVLVWQEHLEEFSRIGRYASVLHERLALGALGYWTVVVSTGAAVLLEIGGLVLWWKKKTLLVRRGTGWRRMAFDLHHMVGAVCLPLMLILAATGFAMAFVDANDQAELYRLLGKWHKGHFPFAVKILYTIATLGFVVQGLTGFVMWWKRA